MFTKLIVPGMAALVLCVRLKRLLRCVECELLGSRSPAPAPANTHFEALMDEYERKQKARRRASLLK